jgi:metal-responsive CopG/Arc/MetJ family transcriptional regulator
MEKKDVRIQLVISPSEVEALDEWRARNKVWSRSEAIREAVRRMVSPHVDRPKQ